jgi:hypothetical protein
MHPDGEKLGEFLNGRFRCRAERVFAPFDRLPFRNFVCLELERIRIGYIGLAQVPHWNRDIRLAIARSERDGLIVDVKVAELIPE